MSIIKKANYFVKGLKEKPKYMYTQEDMREYEEYIEKNFGKFKVYHELYSPDIHIDILIVPPSPEANYYKLITEGIGAYKMNTPEELNDYRLDRMELITYLPPSWDMKIDEQVGWIISNMKLIGRVPIMNNTFICSGQTISYYDENDIKDKKFCASLLINGMTYNNKELHFRFDENRKINFYQVIPIFKEELQYKLDNGLEAFLDVLDDNRLDLVVDFNRSNLCEDKNQEKAKLIENEIEEEIEK